MPAEVIDPQLNQTERTWGVLRDLENHSFAIYRKGDINSELRYVCQGTIVDVDHYGEASPVEPWNGDNLEKEAFGVNVNHELTGPVYAMLNKRMKETFFKNNNSAKDTLKAVRDEIKNKDKHYDDQDITNADSFNSDYYNS